ncbi:phage protein Gp27 family protein [Pseudomonas paralcaligenes]|uniref:phage protein Gp27 family protein n=1 Tax=Pseudomonas paralcaligenes TaxID=2772558 RepID=UPI001C8123A2|nr:phage protein Gp27 family protein [Pseudomonas paralcaligenes]
MGRKSSIEKARPEVRSFIDRLMRENRLTLDEMRELLETEFPHDDELPSRQALGRYRKGVTEIMRSQREIQVASQALVAELGESFDDKTGAFLAQSITTLATRAAQDALGNEETDIGDVLDLARAAKYAQETRSLSFKERQAVAKEARERLLEEQKAALAAMPVKGGVTEETKQAIRAALGIS